MMAHVSASQSQKQVNADAAGGGFDGRSVTITAVEPIVREAKRCVSRVTCTAGMVVITAILESTRATVGSSNKFSTPFSAVYRENEYEEVRSAAPGDRSHETGP